MNAAATVPAAVLPDADPPPARWPDRVAYWLDARANPMLLKDLRLWMRTRKFLVLYFFVLFGSVLAAALYTVLARSEHFDGRGMWAILCGTLAVITGAVVPYFVFERFRQELGNGATDLVLLSALTPGQLVFGKLMSAWCASLLSAAAATPMLVTAYLLGGIDFQITLYSLAVLILGAGCMPMVQLYVATLGKRTTTLRGLAIMVLAGQVILGIVGAGPALYGFMEYGGELEGEAWFVLLALGGAAVLFCHFLFRLAVMPLRSARANREAAPRAALMILVYGGALLGALAMWGAAAAGNRGSWDVDDTANALGLFGIIMLMALCLGTVLLSGTSEIVSRRLRSVWSDHPVRRLLFFPGVHRLTAFFLFNSLLVSLPLFVAWWLKNGLGQNSNEALIFVWAGAGLFTIVAAGLAAHLYIVLPFRRKRTLPPPAFSLVIVNIVLGLQATVAFVFHSAGKLSIDALSVAQGFCPSTVFVTALEPRHRERDSTICMIGTAFAVVLAMLLIRAVLARPRTELPPPGESAPAAAAPASASTSASEGSPP